MIRKFATCLIIISLLVLQGCGSKEKIRFPDLDNIELLAACKNCNLQIYKDFSWWHCLTFDIISKKELKNIDLKIDIKTPYKFGVVEQEITDMPYYVFQTYQDIDWSKMCKLYLDVNTLGSFMPDSQEVKSLAEYENAYIDSYETFISTSNQELYYYELYIFFDITGTVLDENEFFEEIIFYANGQEYLYEIGRVELDYSTSIPLDKSILEPQSGAADIPISPHPQGAITVSDAQFLCNQDLEITDISVLNTDVEIVEISIGTEIDGISMDQKFIPDSSLVLQRGTLINPRILLHDNNFVDKHLYTTTIYLKIDYRSHGHSYVTILETNFRSRPNLFELVAILHEDLDFLPYYYNYRVPVNEVMKGGE